MARAASLGLLCSLSLAPAAAEDAPRGPSPLRDAHLLAQPRLTLPAATPFVLAPGRFTVEVSTTIANSFSWTQDEAGEAPKDRRFLIDGEAVLADVTLRRGLSANFDAALRVPVRHRGGGFLDGFIDWWHGLVNVPDGDRPLFVQDAFRVEGLTTDKAPFSWNEARGTGLGDVEVEARYRVLDGDSDAPSIALVGRVSLPTGSGPFAGNGLGAGVQLLSHVPLSSRFDLHLGAGATVQDPGSVRGVEYVPARAHGFLALEWRPLRTLSLVVDTNAATRLVENIDTYPGTHWILNVTTRIDLSDTARLDLGFTENLKSQLTTTDFALYLGLSLRP